MCETTSSPNQQRVHPSQNIRLLYDGAISQGPLITNQSSVLLESDSDPPSFAQFGVYWSIAWSWMFSIFPTDCCSAAVSNKAKHCLFPTHHLFSWWWWWGGGHISWLISNWLFPSLKDQCDTSLCPAVHSRGTNKWQMLLWSARVSQPSHFILHLRRLRTPKTRRPHWKPLLRCWRCCYITSNGQNSQQPLQSPSQSGLWPLCALTGLSCLTPGSLTVHPYGSLQSVLPPNHILSDWPLIQKEYTVSQQYENNVKRVSTRSDPGSVWHRRQPQHPSVKTTGHIILF